MRSILDNHVRYVTTNDRGKITQCSLSQPGHHDDNRPWLNSSPRPSNSGARRSGPPGTAAKLDTKPCRIHVMLEVLFKKTDCFLGVNWGYLCFTYILTWIFYHMSFFLWNTHLWQDSEAGPGAHCWSDACHHTVLCHRGPFFCCLAWFFIKVQRRKTATGEDSIDFFGLRFQVSTRAVPEFHAGEKPMAFCRSFNWKGSSTAQLWQFWHFEHVFEVKQHPQ